MRVGTDVRISPQAVIIRPEFFDTGDHVVIDPYVVITTAVTLGSYVHLGPHCSVTGQWDDRLVMEDFSCLGAGSRIICSADDYWGEGLAGEAVPFQYRCVRISTVALGRFAMLGANVTVFPGVTIGEGVAVVAASMVDADLEPWGIYAGNPLQQIGTRQKEKLLAYAEVLLHGSHHAEGKRVKPLHCAFSSDSTGGAAKVDHAAPTADSVSGCRVPSDASWRSAR